MDRRTVDTPASVVLSAPGRVNLIGEHTDYTGGLVLPMAIPFATRATVTPLAGETYEFRSSSFAVGRSLGPGQGASKAGDWSDYPVGVLRELQALGVRPAPCLLELDGDVPLGAGLSSSASVEVATAVALLSWAGVTMPAAEIALLCQRAENRYVGSPCGIMDQFVIAAAVEGHALLLDTSDLSFELLPMQQGTLAACEVIVVNSGVRHSVGDGVYGVRRREVEAGQAAVLARYPAFASLGEASLEQLEACAHAMPPENFLRCRHIVTENERVRQARAAMLHGDAARLGQLMDEAHQSYRDDFAASVPEVDFLVETARALPGCHGARLTGGGFGGCTVNLVETDEAEAFSHSVRAAYRERFGVEAPVYPCHAVDGAVARQSAAVATQYSAVARQRKEPR